MSSEILNIIKACCKKGDLPYTEPHADKKISETININISPVVTNVIQAYKMEIIHEGIKNPYTLRGLIHLPPKENFYSSSNYNHIIIHESNHRLSLQKGLSTDYIAAYMNYKADKSSERDFKAIEKAFRYNQQDVLTVAEKSLMVAYAKDETAIELSSYLLMKKIGIKPDPRDTAYMMWNISENNKTLEKMGIDFTRDFMTLNEIVTRTDKLQNISTKEYEKVNNIVLDRHKDRERER